MTVLLQLRAFDRALGWLAIPVAGIWALPWLAADTVAATNYALAASVAWSGLVAGFAVRRIHDWHGAMLAPRFRGSLFAAGAILIGTVGATGLALCGFAGNHMPLIGPTLLIGCGIFFGLVDRPQWSVYLGPSFVDRLSPWAFAAGGVLALFRHLDGTFPHDWPQIVEIGFAGMVLVLVRRGLNSPRQPANIPEAAFFNRTRYGGRWNEEVWTEAQASIVVLGIIVAFWLVLPTAWQSALAVGLLGGLWALFAAASLAESLRSLPLRLRWNWLLAGPRSRTDAGRQVSVRIVLRIATSLPVGAAGVLLHASQDSVLGGEALLDELLLLYVGLLAAAFAGMRFQSLERSVRRYSVPWIALGGVSGAGLAGFAPFSPNALGIAILVVTLLSLAAMAAVLGGRDMGRVEIVE
ncbi:MAG: hypothetical protein OXH68_07920 [Gammaproteobacteria bacterium]|nr:hypothetical protein [Gammaproteobacteria bacterium]